MYGASSAKQKIQCMIFTLFFVTLLGEQNCNNNGKTSRRRAENQQTQPLYGIEDGIKWVPHSGKGGSG